MAKWHSQNKDSQCDRGSQSTISRELQRNKDENSDIYDWAIAQRKSNERQQTRARFHRLTEAMRENIVTKLSMDRSPEQIKGDCRAKGVDCDETIYQMIWKDKEGGGTMYTHTSDAKGAERRNGDRKTSTDD